MKAIKSMMNSNKGLIAFLLLLCFFSTGFAKAFTLTVPAHFSTSKKQNSGKQIISTPEEGSQSFFSQFDGDADDADLFFHTAVSEPQFYFAEALPAQQRNSFSLYSENYTVALYDLYCNWKFHLI